MTDLSAMPRAIAGLEIRVAGNEQLVHDPVSGNVYVLNAAAGRVLSRCDGTTTLAQIAGDLVAASNVDGDRAARDVAAVCADFKEKGLIA